MTTYYSIIISGSVPSRRALYRVKSGGRDTGVGKWQPLSRCWKKSALYKDEAALMRAGAIHMRPEWARSLQTFWRNNPTVAKQLAQA